MTRSRLVATAALSAFLLLGCSGEESASSDATPSTTSDSPARSSATTDAEPPADRASAAAEDAVLLEEVLVADPARELDAYRFLLPEGWTLEGGVQAMPPAYHMVPFFSDVTVRAPDGRGARFWGMLEFGYADGVQLPPIAPFQGRSFFRWPASLGDYWQRVFELSPAEGVTKLEVVSETVLPEATERIRELFAPMYESTRAENRQLAMTGESKEFDADVRRLVIRYDEHGERIEATIFATVRHAVYRYPGGAVRAAMWNLDHMYAVFGPVGTDPLRDPVIAAVVRSRTELPNWQRAIQRWYLAKNQQIVAEGNAKIAAAARSAAVARTSESQSVLDISFQGWKDRNAANDAGHARSIEGIHERTTYAAPGGTTVELPSHYRNVYADGLGHYVLHDDANYEINTDPAFNDRDWQRIEPQR